MTEPYKSRRRLTTVQQAELDAALIAITEELHPITCRGLFYVAERRIPHIVPKDEQGYGVVQRKLLELRKSEHIPYDHIILLAPPDSD
jgi:hypothetical protein